MSKITTDIREQFDNEINIVATQNDTFAPEVLEVVNVDESVTPNVETPFDLTGYTGKMIVRHNFGDTQEILVFQTTDSTMSFGGANNNEITLFQANTAMSMFGEFVYDLQVTKTSDTTVSTIQGGTFNINQDVTR